MWCFSPLFSSASRTLQSRFSNVRISFLQTCEKDYYLIPHFILLTVWKITTMDESNEFPLTPHYLVGIGNSQPTSSIFLSMVFAGFRTIPAMDVVKDPNKLKISFRIVLNFSAKFNWRSFCGFNKNHWVRNNFNCILIKCY